MNLELLLAYLFVVVEILVLIQKLNHTSASCANVYLQGISIRPLIEFINVRRTNRNLDTINVEIHCRVCRRRRRAVKYDALCFHAVLTFLLCSQLMEHTIAGIEDLCGQWSRHYWKDK